MINFVIGVFRGWFGQIFSWVGGYVSQRAALRVAWVAFVASLVVAMFAAVNALISGLVVALPSNLVIAGSWVVPDNTNECLAAYLSAHAIRFAYDYKFRISQQLSLF
jgi:hypothetical protein